MEKWDIVFFKRDNGRIPGEEFLDACPSAVEAKIHAIVDAVAAAPPPRFSVGGMWEAMHGGMGGFYEIRVQGPNREQFRLFCILDNADPGQLKELGLDHPTIAILDGLRKPWMTKSSEKHYARVRMFGDEYRRVPRPIAR